MKDHETYHKKSEINAVIKYRKKSKLIFLDDRWIISTDIGLFQHILPSCDIDQVQAEFMAGIHSI